MRNKWFNYFIKPSSSWNPYRIGIRERERKRKKRELDIFLVFFIEILKNTNI